MPTLIKASGGRIALEANRTYVMGRGLDCDVVVEDIASSRHHACLRVGATRQVVSIEDLGSRNGTFVNGQRIATRTVVEDGAFVRIGATIYRFRTSDDPDDQEKELDTGTVGLERLSFGQEVAEEIVRVVRSEGRASSDIAGQLGAFSVLEVLQILMQSGRSGTLHVALAGGHATIEVRRGEILAAAYGDRQGFDALVLLAREDSGMFWLVESGIPCPRNVEVPSSRLLLELCCTLDEDGS